MNRRVIVSADDFGLSEAVNEGVERAHRDGILSTASLMVAGDAADDAVRRAKRMPALSVGLHLVVIEGRSARPPADIPDLVGADGRFGSDQVRRGFRYAFDLRVREQLASEVRGQFEAYAATGLPLDHANAHKHMHLHPVVLRLLIGIGAEYGLRAVRVPTEPAAALLACGTTPTLGGAALRAWSRRARSVVLRAGMVTTDHCFGIAWSGAMNAGRLRCLTAHLPPGTSEIYFHPAAARDAVLDRWMPSYDHEGELAALLDPAFVGIMRMSTDWSTLASETRAVRPRLP